MTSKPLAWQLIGGLMLVLAAAFFMLAPAFASNNQPRVALSALETVETDAPLILLGQIITIDSAPENLKSRLAGIKIGRAAQAGHTRNISRDYILLRLRQSGFDPAHFDIRLPSKIQVRRSAVKITREEMEMMVRDHLIAASPSSDARVNITAVRIKKDVLLPKGTISHEVHVPHQSAPSRLLPVTLAFAVDGRFERKVSALVGLEVIQNVVVSRKPIPRLKIITPDDVMLRPMNVVARGDAVIRAVEDVIGRRARRAIGMNATLHAGLVEWPPVVKKGDRVLIIAESGNLRITTMGEVKSTGKVGEQVRVVNLDSKKTVMAQVLDGRTVRVAF